MLICDKTKVVEMINSNETSKKECYCEETEGIPIIRFHCLDDIDFVSLAFSTRFGGVSRKEYLSSLNFGWDRGDDEENVRENYKKMCHALGADYRKLVLSDQVHDVKVEYVDERYAADEKIVKKLDKVDGMVTDRKGLTLATSYADCVPLFFVDKKKKVIGSSHSGWRGTVARIGEKTIKKLNECFGSSPEDIICIIGPSICQSCYEVSEDVALEFVKEFGEDKCNARKIVMKKQRTKDKYLLNLWEANKIQFLEAGISESNIHMSGICTCCNPDILYSHRASKGKRGNLNGFIMLK